MSESVNASLDAAGTETIRVPRNIMGLLRQSYDTREKVLDWMLAIALAITLVWLFQDRVTGLFHVDPDANAGRDDPPVPSQEVDSAIPPCNETTARIYTYNLPSSRTIRHQIGPSVTPPPIDPSRPPMYP